jgi:hypothetical protein
MNAMKTRADRRTVDRSGYPTLAMSEREPY